MKSINLEYTAEDLISYKLQRNGILIAKPKFDIKGTDLIAFIEFGDSVKIGRIQSKGRTLYPKQEEYARIYIPSKYVYDAFFLFIYYDIGIDNTDVYLYTAEQIKNTWKKNKKEEYYLNIKYNQLRKFEKYLFSEKRIDEIIKIIKQSKSEIEKLLLELLQIQREQIDEMEEINSLTKTILEIENTKIEIEKTTLELEKYENELKLFYNKIIDKMPNELVIEIKNQASMNYKIDKDLEVKCVKYIDKMIITDVVKYIVEAT